MSAQTHNRKSSTRETAGRGQARAGRKGPVLKEPIEAVGKKTTWWWIIPKKGKFSPAGLHLAGEHERRGQRQISIDGRDFQPMRESGVLVVTIGTTTAPAPTRSSLAFRSANGFKIQGPLLHRHHLNENRTP